LSSLISKPLKTIELKIEIEALDDDYRTHGMDKISFLVSANPGQPLQALNKVASGGELSRISLAIATITAEQQLAPSIIFDEVDVGIGGATAEVWLPAKLNKSIKLLLKLSNSIKNNE